MKKDYVGAAMSEERRRPCGLGVCEREGKCGREREDGRHCSTEPCRGRLAPLAAEAVESREFNWTPAWLADGGSTFSEGEDSCRSRCVPSRSASFT